MCPVSNLNMLIFFHEIVVIFVPLEEGLDAMFLNFLHSVMSTRPT